MNIKVLIVDRRMAARNELARPLKKLGVWDVVQITPQAVVSEALPPGDFDIAFVEFNTLKQVGPALIKSLRANDAHLPVVVTYPSTIKMADLKTHTSQASTCCVSPITAERLRTTIEQCVASITA